MKLNKAILIINLNNPDIIDLYKREFNVFINYKKTRNYSFRI